jgi:hypothetical protein
MFLHLFSLILAAALHTSDGSGSDAGTRASTPTSLAASHGDGRDAARSDVPPAPAVTPPAAGGPPACPGITEWDGERCVAMQQSWETTGRAYG